MNEYIYVVVAGSGCICISIRSDAAQFGYGLRSHGLDPDETTSVTSIGVVWSGDKPVGKAAWAAAVIVHARFCDYYIWTKVHCHRQCTFVSKEGDTLRKAMCFLPI